MAAVLIGEGRACKHLTGHLWVQIGRGQMIERTKYVCQRSAVIVTFCFFPPTPNRRLTAYMLTESFSVLTASIYNQKEITIDKN